MYTTLATLINRLDCEIKDDIGVIKWSAPIPSFGDIDNSTVATLGLNPSNKEFLDESGNELEGITRRFHTLNSLGINSWSEVEARHLDLIAHSCINYFNINPYDAWFKKLDRILFGTKTSYYSVDNKACHLDLIPYATIVKWGELPVFQKDNLFKITGNILGFLLRDSPINILILNGKTVVEQFELISQNKLKKTLMPSWNLPRKKENVPGIAYSGFVDTFANIPIGRKILILGYNHNIQSSYGVSNRVVNSICNWIKKKSEEILG